MKKLLLFILGLLACATTFAQQSYLYCNQIDPGGYIYLGYTIDQIIATCGQPLERKHQVRQPTKTVTMEEWRYNYRPNSPFSHSELIAKDDALVIDFLDNKAVEIFVEGQSVKKTFYCNAQVPLKLGDTRQTAYQLCFWASTKAEIQKTEKEPPVNQLLLRYQPTQNGPTKDLIFEKGKLVKIQDEQPGSGI